MNGPRTEIVQSSRLLPRRRWYSVGGRCCCSVGLDFPGLAAFFHKMKTVFCCLQLHFWPKANSSLGTKNCSTSPSDNSHLAIPFKSSGFKFNLTLTLVHSSWGEDAHYNEMNVVSKIKYAVFQCAVLTLESFKTKTLWLSMSLSHSF